MLWIWFLHLVHIVEKINYKKSRGQLTFWWKASVFFNLQKLRQIQTNEAAYTRNWSCHLESDKVLLLHSSITFGSTTLSKTTLSLTTLSIMTLRNMTFSITINKKAMPSITALDTVSFMLSVIYSRWCYAECRKKANCAGCCYTECIHSLCLRSYGRCFD